jgi:predicted nucleic acid-binding protein
MREYFVDTWFLIAALDRHDDHHQRALRVGRALRETPLVTHDAVLTEMLAYVSAEGPWMRQLAVETVQTLRRRYAVLSADRTLFDRALILYAERRDKAYSLVDCMSMVVMRDRGITHVLTNDHHFSQEGFTVVNQ